MENTSLEPKRSKIISEMMRIQLNAYQKSEDKDKDYMKGLYNGMALTRAIIENQPAILLDKNGNLG